MAENTSSNTSQGPPTLTPPLPLPGRKLSAPNAPCEVSPTQQVPCCLKAGDTVSPVYFGGYLGLSSQRGWRQHGAVFPAAFSSPGPMASNFQSLCCHPPPCTSHLKVPNQKGQRTQCPGDYRGKGKAVVRPGRATRSVQWDCRRKWEGRDQAR